MDLFKNLKSINRKGRKVRITIWFAKIAKQGFDKMLLTSRSLRLIYVLQLSSASVALENEVAKVCFAFSAVKKISERMPVPPGLD